MQIKELNHREMLRAGNLTDLQIRWNESGRNQEYDFFGDIDNATNELKRFAKIDFKKALETRQDIKELIQGAAKAKASIECDLSYTSPQGVDYDVYYNVGPFLIERYLKDNNCCKILQTLIIDNISIDDDGNVKIDKQCIIDDIRDDEDYFLEEELMDSYIEAIEQASGWHWLTLEEGDGEEELDMNLLNDILDSYLE
jgi:hypothetical protein